MLATFMNKLKDAGTLAALCQKAEQIARSEGQGVPGSEHFVLAALSLPDGTGLRTMASLGATPEGFAEAIGAQFVEALRHAGMEIASETAGLPGSSPRPPAASKLYHSAPSGQRIVQRLASTAEERQNRSLLAADVLLAVAEEKFSIASRALDVLGITQQQLVDAASREIALYGHRHA